MGGFRFFSPHWLIFLPVVALAAWRAWHPRLRAAALYSNVADLKRLPVTFAQRVKRLLPWTSLLGLVLLTFALARPQMGKSESRVNTEGIAIELAIDVSGSMEEAHDFVLGEKSVSRIAAVKYVVDAFINGSKESKLSGRPNDLIGLVAFGGFADSRCPLTLDHGALTEALRQLEVPKPIYDRASGAIMNGEELQTAIGDGLLAGADRLKNVNAKSKILILLTDGDNNLGSDPREAAKAVEALGIKVYTICIGTNDPVPVVGKDPIFGVERMVGSQVFPIDEKLLQDIADTAHGKYFHAYGTDALTSVYAEIDKLEKTKVEETKYTDYTEYFGVPAIAGLALLLGALVLSSTRFRAMP
ncbi:MAG TPA: VWA domain-containing protein [Planctomycetota bacterium]|nr:VWA domain-containing protein [Planctomycetota bacterium]